MDAPPKNAYREALARLEAVHDREARLSIHRRCLSTVLTHGRKVERSAVYFHGFTSCPAQGFRLAEHLHDGGYNVYLPRMSGHGGHTPREFSMADFSAAKLVDMANEAMDIACGLGHQVVALGLSAGGTIASWVAQFRSDAWRVVAISPFLGPFFLPGAAVDLTSRSILGLPNLVIGWNPLARVAPADVDYPFARPASHALAEIMRLGSAVRSAARMSPPAASSIGVLLNAADRAVSNEVTRDLVASWEGHGTRVDIEVLPASAKLPHDIINPFEKGNDFDTVYARLKLLLPGFNG